MVSAGSAEEKKEMDANPVETTSVSQLQADPQGGRRLHGFALFSVLAALMLSLLLEALDQTVVGTALPRIVASLNGFDRYTWAVTAYILASVTMVLIVGKLSDMFGRKWFLIAGVAIFLLGSALSGASQDMNQLIVFRALQGLGAGIGIALVFTVVGDIFPPAERARWQGIFGVVYAFSNLVGPTLGGWLTDHGPLLGSLVTETTRWRWVFYINVPVGILALIALLVYLPATISQPSTQFRGWVSLRRVDFLGGLLVASATICLLLGLTWGSNATYAWTSPQVIGILACSVVLYVLFFIDERFARDPLLALDLFRNQVFSMALLLSFLQLVVLIGIIIYLPLYLQGVLGVSPTNAGAAITPLTISVVIGGGIASALVARFLRYQLVTIVSGLIMTVGVFLLMTQISTTSSILEMSIFMAIIGIGLGPFFSVLQLAAQNAIPRSRLGVGTAAVRSVTQIGAVMGVAVVGTVVNQSLSNDIVTRVPASTVKLITPAGFKYATDPQALISPSYREGVVHTAQRFAVHAATTNIPPGPQHAQQVASVTAQVMQQVQSMLTQLFDALKESLTVAIQHGLIAILVVCVGMVVATFFLKDIPMAKEFASGTADGTQPAAADGAQPIEASTAQSVGADGTKPVEASTIQPEASDKNKPVS
jgi:EmrB/QacA subfamily drug resistance transporter